jgi:hypothetical protein
MRELFGEFDLLELVMRPLQRCCLHGQALDIAVQNCEFRLNFPTLQNNNHYTCKKSYKPLGLGHPFHLYVSVLRFE